jgi:hypothetical protein
MSFSYEIYFRSNTWNTILPFHTIDVGLPLKEVLWLPLLAERRTGGTWLGYSMVPHCIGLQLRENTAWPRYRMGGMRPNARFEPQLTGIKALSGVLIALVGERQNFARPALCDRGPFDYIWYSALARLLVRRFLLVVWRWMQGSRWFVEEL